MKNYIESEKCSRTISCNDVEKGIINDLWEFFDKYAFFELYDLSMEYEEFSKEAQLMMESEDGINNIISLLDDYIEADEETDKAFMLKKRLLEEKNMSLLSSTEPEDEPEESGQEL